MAHRALIAGGGVAGVELLLGLGELAGERVEITMLAPEPEFTYTPLLVEELFALIKSIHAEGIALMLVEQNVVQSLEVAARAYILDNGVFVLEGSAADIRHNAELKRAYLGM